MCSVCRGQLESLGKQGESSPGVSNFYRCCGVSQLSTNLNMYLFRCWEEEIDSGKKWKKGCSWASWISRYQNGPWRCRHHLLSRAAVATSICFLLAVSGHRARSSPTLPLRPRPKNGRSYYENQRAPLVSLVCHGRGGHLGGERTWWKTESLVSRLCSSVIYGSTNANETRI